MKIVAIFANQLFAFHYDSEKMNELRRLLTIWSDTAYLYEFIKSNKRDIPSNTSIQKLIYQLITNSKEIEDTLNIITLNEGRNLDEFFKPLDNQEYQIIELSKQKGRNIYLRIYAIKIDTNCFVITGGAIKFHHLNNDRPHTRKEMQKIDKCRDFLKDNHVFDADSFYEFLNE